MSIQHQNSLPCTATCQLSTQRVAMDLAQRTAWFTSVGGNREKHFTDISGMSPGDLGPSSGMFGDNLLFAREGHEAKYL